MVGDFGFDNEEKLLYCISMDRTIQAKLRFRRRQAPRRKALSLAAIHEPLLKPLLKPQIESSADNEYLGSGASQKSAFCGLNRRKPRGKRR